MLKLAFASLRFRIASSLAIFAAVSIGCALFVTGGGLLETALRLVAPPQRLSGPSIVVTGPTGYRLNDTPEVIPYSEQVRIPAKMMETIAKDDEVDKIVADISFSAILDNVAATKGGLYGHEWKSAELTPYHIRNGAAPEPGQVVIDAASAQQAGLHVNDPASVLVNGTARSFILAGIVEADDVQVPSLFFASTDAKQFLLHEDKVDSFGVFTRPGANIEALADRLRQALPADTSVFTGDKRGFAEFNTIPDSRLPLFLLAGVLGSMALTAMILIVSASISLAVRQRRQELALLRATGATPRQVYRLVVAEIMVVAVLAVGGGVCLGSVSGDWLFAFSTQRGVFPEALEFRQSILAFAVSALISLLIVWITARVAAMSAVRIRPIQALAEAAIPPVRVSPARRYTARLCAALTVGLAGVSLFMNPELAVTIGGSAILTGAIAVALLAPEIIHTLAGIFSKAGHLLPGGIGILAVKNLRSRAVQFAAILIPLTLAVALALGNLYSSSTLNAAMLRSFMDQFQAQVVVSSTSGGLAQASITEIRDAPGVKAASPLIISQGWIEKPYDASHGSDPWPLLGIDKEQILATPVSEGSLQDLQGDTAAIPQKQAKDLGLTLGDTVGIRFGDGSQKNVTLVALLNGPNDYASIILPAALLSQHTTTGLPAYVLVRADPSQDTNALMSSIREKTADRPDIQVGNKQVLAKDFTARLDIQAWISYLLAFLAVGYAAVAGINAWAVVVLGRRQELGMQRLLGSTRRHVLGMLLFEAALVILMSLVLGTVAALFAVVPIAIATGLLLPEGPMSIYGGIAAAVFLISLPVVAYFGSRVTKHKPIEAISMPAE